MDNHLKDFIEGIAGTMFGYLRDKLKKNRLLDEGQRDTITAFLDETEADMERYLKQQFSL